MTIPRTRPASDADHSAVHASTPQAGLPRRREAVGLSGHELSVGYRGVAVVSKASVRVRPGRVTVLVGPNGSGKSTLLRTLARLHEPHGGQVTLHAAPDGRPQPVSLLSAREYGRHVTLLSQQRPTPSGLRVQDVIAFGRHPHRGRWRSADPDGPGAVRRALDLTGLTEMADRAVDELSGGELQRVWLATCLAQDTGVLLLDEPTNHLDLRYQVEVLDLVRELAVDHGVAVGVVLHDLTQAAEVADEVVLLHDRRVLASGPPARVLTEAHLTAAYGIPVRVSTDPVTGALAPRPLGRFTRVA